MLDGGGGGVSVMMIHHKLHAMSAVDGPVSSSQRRNQTMAVGLIDGTGHLT